MKILQEIYGAHPMTGDLIMSFNKFDRLVAEYLCGALVERARQQSLPRGMQELNLAIKERFDAAGINFAFPTRTVYVKQEAEAAREVARRRAARNIPHSTPNIQRGSALIGTFIRS